MGVRDIINSVFDKVVSTEEDDDLEDSYDVPNDVPDISAEDIEAKEGE